MLAIAETGIGNPTLPLWISPKQNNCRSHFCYENHTRKCYEENVDINFRIAYGTVSINGHLNSMNDLGYPKKLIRLTEMTMEGAKSMLTLQGTMSKSIFINRGQGDPISFI